MIPSGALNSCHLAQEKGNEELTLIKQTSGVKQGSWFCSDTFSLKPLLITLYIFHPMLGSFKEFLLEALEDSSYISFDVLP